MSNAIFPTLAGLAWSTYKTPNWNTKTQKSVNGAELRAKFFIYPIWNFTLSFEFLRADAVNAELQTLLAFFNARSGSYDDFLFMDPTDHTATSQVIATGDGSTKNFPLLHSIGGWVEPIGYSNDASIYVNGVFQSSGVVYNSTNNGIVFTTAPAAGATITWSGNFYYRVRFAKDANEFENFMKDLWSSKKIEMVTAR